MRILHLDPDDIDNPLSGGGPVRTLEIYRRMARRHEITVLTPTFPGSTPELVRNGIRYLRLGRRIGNHGSSHHLSFLAALPAAVRRHDYDLLVEDTMPPASVTWTPLFRRRNKPMIASVQWWFAHEYTRRLRLPFHWGQTHGLKLYDHFVVLTEQMRQTVQSHHARADCRVISNGVDARLFELPLRAGFGVLYIGRIEMHAKGLDLLLHAWASLPEARRPWLTVAGFGNGQAAFDLLVEELRLRPWVRTVGKVDAATRARLLSECRCTVMPSREETFGMTISEANAAGKLALVFDHWPMNEVAAPACPRVPAFDAAAFGQAVLRVVESSDATLLDQGNACRRWARRYDWDAVSRQQEDYYLKVAAAHGDAPFHNDQRPSGV